MTHKDKAFYGSLPPCRIHDSFVESRALLIEYGALLIEYKALLIEHRAVLMECMAFFSAATGCWCFGMRSCLPREIGLF